MSTWLIITNLLKEITLMERDKSIRVRPMLNSSHLGELIRENINELDWSVTETALRLGYERGTLSRLLNGKVEISAKMVIALENIGWGKADQWMRLQACYELAQARRQISAA